MQKRKRILTLFVVFTVLVVCAELVTRQLFPPVEASDLPTPDAGSITLLKGAAALPKAENAITIPPLKGVGWGFEPGSIVEQGNIQSPINSLGIRGEEIPKKQKDEIRFLLLGDSSVFGYGVTTEDTFGEVAATQLQKIVGQDARAVNGAIPGHSSEQSSLLLREIGAEIAPDFVVIANMWSDIYDGTKPEDAPVSSFALVRLGTEWLEPWRKPRKISWVYTGADLSAPPEDGPRVALRTYRKNLLQLVEQSKALGAKPLFLMLPVPIDMAPGGAPEWLTQYRLVMEHVAVTQNVPLVDAPSWFENHNPSAKDFYDNVHPSREGHQKIGMALAEVLSQQLQR